MMAKYTIHYFVKIDSEKMSLTHYCHYNSFTVIKKCDHAQRHGYHKMYRKI